jgi:hypothetical protein
MQKFGRKKKSQLGNLSWKQGVFGKHKLLGQQSEFLLENHITANDTRGGQKTKLYAFKYVM